MIICCLKRNTCWEHGLCKCLYIFFNQQKTDYVKKTHCTRAIRAILLIIDEKSHFHVDYYWSFIIYICLIMMNGEKRWKSYNATKRQLKREIYLLFCGSKRIYGFLCISFIPNSIICD